jgi:hypothetical protein
VQVDKKTLVTVLLLAVIVAAAIVFLRWTGLIGGSRPPQWVMDKQLELIDLHTQELMTETLDKWDAIGHDVRGYCKNPKTGEFTMARPIICRNCGEKIPPPEMTVEDVKKPAMLRLMADYKCPKCGKLAKGGDTPAH